MSAAIDAVVIGGSAGALDALAPLLAALPAGFEPAILLVVHLPPAPHSPLSQALAARTALAVVEALDKQPLAPGTIHTAPPDYHLLVEEDGTLSLSRDPAVHHSRPSIDVLFESAALVFGPRVAAVLLSGANPDGAAGLAAIATAGGRTAIQDPATASWVEMPRAGLVALAGAADLVAAPAALGAWLAGLARGDAP